MKMVAQESNLFNEDELEEKMWIQLNVYHVEGAYKLASIVRNNDGGRTLGQIALKENLDPIK